MPEQIPKAWVKYLNEKEKQKAIKRITDQLLLDAHIAMKDRIDRALNSSAIDIARWDPKHHPYILPKIISIALLEEAADQLKTTGTSFEKEVKSEVKNLKLFL